MKDLFHEDKPELSVLEAQYSAQRIAFAPVIFQTVRALRDLRVLAALDHQQNGLTIGELAEQTGVSEYGLALLLESGMTADVVLCEDDRWRLTKTGWFILKDEMTNINMDYNHHVSYQGLFHLDQSIRQQRPVGLKAMGDWPVIYPGLTSLPDVVRESWFRLDHYYSGSATEQACALITAEGPDSLLEIGANTGRFSLALARRVENIEITLLDLPEQIAVIRENLATEGLEGRVSTVAADILDDKPLPGRYDLIWMSQFLDCFSKADIVTILSKAKAALEVGGRIMVMEPLWDRQRFEASAYCIINTSPYFTVMANGVSKMYSFVDLAACIADAGLVVTESVDGLGVCQSVIKCEPS